MEIVTPRPSSITGLAGFADFEREAEEATSVNQRWQDALLDVALKFGEEPAAGGAAQGRLQFAVDLKFAVELADADIDAFVRALAEAESQRDANDEGGAGAGALVDVYVDVEAEADELLERIDEFFDGFERLPENQSGLLKFRQRAADGGVVRLDGEDRPETRDVYVDIVRRNAKIPRLGCDGRVNDAAERRRRRKRAFYGPFGAFGEVGRRRRG